MTMLEIRCFHQLQVTIHGARLHELDHSPTLRTLLCYFILHRGQVLSRSRIAGLLWPNLPEAQARRALNTALWRLRRLGDSALAACLQTTVDFLQWGLPASAWLDLDEFEALTRPVADARVKAPLTDRDTLAQLERAALLYHGALLEDCDADWCDLPRLRFQECYVQVLEVLVSGYEQQGMPTHALRCAEALVRAEPYNESGHAATIRLHLALDRHQAALAAYQRYARLWRDELDLPPSEHVLRLIRAVVRANGAPDAPDMAVLALTHLARMATLADVPESLSRLASQCTRTLFRTLVAEAQRVGKAAEGEGVWEMARQAYETALMALETLPAESDCLRQKLDLRLRCDAFYDRVAQRQAQALNLAQALHLAESLADAAAQSEIRARQCWLAQAEGRLHEAVRCGQLALALAGDDQPLRTQAMRLLGASHEGRGEYPKAVAYYQEALALDADRADLLRMDHNNLASVYTSLAQDWLALEHIRAALSLTPKKPPCLVRAIILGNAANIARELGNFSNAMTHLQTAQALAAMLGDRSTETWLAIRASVLYRQAGDLPRAQLSAAHAWRVSNEIVHPRFLIEAALELAWLTCQQHRVAEAHQWLRCAEESMHASAFTRYRGVVALLWSLIHLHDEQVEAAAHTARRALEAIYAGGEFRYLALCHAIGAAIACREGDACSVEIQLEQAHQALRERAARIPDPAARTRFLNATRLRRQLQHRTKLPGLDVLCCA